MAPKPPPNKETSPNKPPRSTLLHLWGQGGLRCSGPGFWGLFLGCGEQGKGWGGRCTPKILLLGLAPPTELRMRGAALGGLCGGQQDPKCTPREPPNPFVPAPRPPAGKTPPGGFFWGVLSHHLG